MGRPQQPPREESQPHCCPGCASGSAAAAWGAVSQRAFLGGVGAATAGTAMLKGLTWNALAAETDPLPSTAASRRPLKVTPILVYSTPKRRASDKLAQLGRNPDRNRMPMTKWLASAVNCRPSQQQADFPVEFAPVAKVRSKADLDQIADLQQADALMVYAAGGWMDVFDTLGKMKKDMIFFCRHKSGPVYLWYEIISPRYLRQHTDKRAVEGVDEQDVVIDCQDELLWRLRSFVACTTPKGMRIVAIGGAGGWAQPSGCRPGPGRRKSGTGTSRSSTYDATGRAAARGPRREWRRSSGCGSRRPNT